MSAKLAGVNDTRRVFWLLASYFLLQLLIRIYVSPNLELDEAEQLILTQQLNWGYGPQPPLYTWLQAGLFYVFGVNHFSLALLKNLLLFCTYAFVYSAGRALDFSRRTAIAAMLSLFLLPQILWESQRDLTHSVLATTLSAATLAVWFHLKKKPSNANYVLLGICWGLGLIAKYNYGIFLVSLLMASLTIAEYRRLLQKPAILYTVASAFVIVTPHVLWMFSNIPLMLSSSGKFKMAARNSYLEPILNGVASLIMACVSFAAILLIIYAVIYIYDRKRNASTCLARVEPDETLLLRCVLISLGICLLMILLFRVTCFKDRWMQQILFLLPLALLPWMRYAFERSGGRLIRILAICLGVATMVGLAGRSRLARYIGTSRFNLPYHDVTSKLKDKIMAADLVVTDKMLLGGNVRMAFPSARVAVTNTPVFACMKTGKTLVLWDYDESSYRREPLQKYLVGTFKRDDLAAAETGAVHAELLYLPNNIMTVGYAVITSHSR